VSPRFPLLLHPDVWTRPARLAPHAAPGGRRRRPLAPLGAAPRATLCRITAAEAAGRLDEAAALWHALGEDGQALRCQVTAREQAGDAAGAAGLLEAQGLLAAAAQAWTRADRPGEVPRSEARCLEAVGRWEAAAFRWTALGEPREAARCRGRLHAQRGEHEAAARAFAEAGEAEAARDAAIQAAQAARDWPRALALAEEAGNPALLEMVRRGREVWLAAERLRAARPTGGPRRPAGPRAQPVPGTGGPPPPRPLQGVLFEPDALAGEASVASGAGSLSPPPGVLVPPLVAAVVEAVGRGPGQRLPELADRLGRPKPDVQACLRVAVGRGVLVKSGQTRGTRYWPAGGPGSPAAPGTPPPA
jgi:hypothetical protein